MRAVGTRLRARAQAAGATQAALAWLGDHGSFVPFADPLFAVITDAVPAK
ncbi:hypothetical protein [Kitasatospora sp. NPDC057198]